MRVNSPYIFRNFFLLFLIFGLLLSFDAKVTAAEPSSNKKVISAIVCAQAIFGLSLMVGIDGLVPINKGEVGRAGSVPIIRLSTNYPILKAIGVDADRLSDEQVAPMVSEIQRAVASYPHGLARELLDDIYIGEHLRNGTNGIGGVAPLYAIIIDHSTSPYALQLRVHHEIGHHLLRKHWNLFPHADWKAANPVGFSYIGSGLQAIREGKGSVTAGELAALRQQGFVSAYARAAIEEDYAELSAYIFADSPWFWNLVEKNPKLSAKVDLVVAFLVKVDPRFSYSLPKRAGPHIPAIEP